MSYLRARFTYTIFGDNSYIRGIRSEGLHSVWAKQSSFALRQLDRQEFISKSLQWTLASPQVSKVDFRVTITDIKISRTGMNILLCSLLGEYQLIRILNSIGEAEYYNSTQCEEYSSNRWQYTPISVNDCFSIVLLIMISFVDIVEYSIFKKNY